MKKARTGQGVKTSDRTIGDIVAADFRTAGVFEKHNIDFCCGGEYRPRW